jgi:flagellar assembly protein FliH
MPRLAADRGPNGPAGLTFDEDEVAALAAAVAAGWSRQGRQAAELDLAARQAAALEQVAEALAATARGRLQAHERVRDEVIRLAEAIAHALVPSLPEDHGGGAAAAVSGLLRTLPDPIASVQVVVDALAAEPLRARLPDIAARAGFTGSLEILADPQLPPGAVQLRWPGGWSEHVPAQVAGEIARLLAAHRAAGPDLAGGLTADAAPSTTANEHHHDHA